MVAAQSWTERKAGRRDWEIVLACIVAFLWIWDVWNRNRTPGSDNHRSSACEMAVDFFVGCRREAENVCRKFSSSLNLQRRIHSWNCNQNCLSNISVASCRIARLYHSKCLFLLLVLQPELSEQYNCKYGLKAEKIVDSGIEEMVAAQSWTERKAGRRDWEIVLACIVAFLWIWDVWNRNRTPGSDNHRSSACEMAVDFFVGCRREAENVCRKFSSSLNLQRRIHSWNCNQNCLSNISVASCRIARLYHSKCLFLLLVLQPELSEQYFCSLWHTECLFLLCYLICNQNCLTMLLQRLSCFGGVEKR